MSAPPVPAPPKPKVDVSVIVQVLQEVESLLPSGTSPPTVVADISALLVASAAIAVGLGAFSNATAQAIVAVVPTVVVVAWRVIAAIRAAAQARVKAALIAAHVGQ